MTLSRREWLKTSSAVGGSVIARLGYPPGPERRTFVQAILQKVVSAVAG